jgi:hypothetical protein
MTREVMKDLIRSLNRDELGMLRYLAEFGIEDWDQKTTVNGKPWRCPECRAEGLLEVADQVVEVWAVEEMTLPGDYEYDLNKSRKWDSLNHGNNYFECVRCQREFQVFELEEMFDVHCAEEEGDESVTT